MWIASLLLLGSLTATESRCIADLQCVVELWAACALQISRHDLKEKNLNLTNYLQDRDLNDLVSAAISAQDDAAGSADPPRKQMLFENASQSYLAALADKGAFGFSNRRSSLGGEKALPLWVSVQATRWEWSP